ncbi:MAG: hypothetical protein KA297_14875 [Kofleriaceae bacterium]|nr:hypothetical protein [Kofleriaceae bacterium]MBP6836708.1 hypothetical protein [Kofleriaceae bacterium]
MLGQGDPERRSADAELEPDGEVAVRCRSCDHVLSQRAEACAQGGAHRHTFVNPGGFVFEVVLYRAAPGAHVSGDLDPAFSWFPGWAWQFAGCGGCTTHVGWRFVPIAGDHAPTFHGLIADRIH